MKVINIQDYEQLKKNSSPTQLAKVIVAMAMWHLGHTNKKEDMEHVELAYWWVGKLLEEMKCSTI